MSADLRPELEFRPFLLCAVCLAIGIAMHVALPFAIFAVVLALVLTGMRSRLIVVAFTFLGFWIWGQREFKAQYRNEEYFGLASVASMPIESPSGEKAMVQIGNRAYNMTFPPTWKLCLGDEILVSGTFRPIPDGSDASYSRMRISGGFRAEALHKIYHYGSPLWRAGAAIRHSFTSYVRSQLPEAVASYLVAIAINDTSGLVQENWINLRNSGTIHIVSTSGTHVMLLAYCLGIALRKLPISRSWQLAILSVLLLALAMAAGFTMPAVRSVIMASTVGWAYLCRRESDLLSSIGLSGSLILLFSPYSLFDAGFQLSFLTVTGLALFGGAYEKSIERTDWSWQDTVREGAYGSLVAWIASAPLVMSLFGMLSLVSVLANILVLFTAPALLIAAYSGWAMSFLWPWLGAILLNHVSAPLIGWTIQIVDTLGSPQWSVLHVPFLEWPWVLAAYLLLLFAWRPRVRPT